MAKQGQKRKGNFQKGASLNKAPYRKDDVFEADDSDPEEEKNVGDRYDRVDNYEYELPSDFEDEEIDEDAAFNSEDERMYGHLFAGRGGGGGGEDSEEDEESGSEGDDGLLDSDEDEESGSGSEEEHEDYDSELDEAFARAGGGGSDDEEQEGEESQENSEEEGDDAARRAMVDALTGAAEGAKDRRRRRDVVVTEAYPESEFNLPGAGPEGELTLTDLIAGLGDGRAKLGAARKALERLEKRAAPVAAPLPGPIRERQERKAGYESAKKDIAKWMPVVKAHREAPTLHFKADAAAVSRTVTTASIAAKHTPETAMEAEVAALLTAAGAQTAAAVAEAEEALAMKELTVAEAAARREKLAKMRALLFYHEKKAKRMKKIKSKEYRRRMKKAEARKAAAAGGDGADDELALDEEELRRQLEDAEFERAQERLTLKHRNTSRFIRRALKRGGQDLDDGTKQAVAEQLRLGEELRQRVHRMGGRRGSGSDDSGTDASDDDSSDDDDGGAGRGELSAKAKAAALEILQGSGGVDGEEAPTEGLFALPFMQRAMARRKAAAAEEARALLELDGGDGGSGDAAAAAAAGGRMKFGGSGEAQRLAERVRAMEAAAAADDSDLEGDEREDADAKAERLAKRLRGGEDEDEAAMGGGGGVLGRVTRQQAKISRQDRLFEGSGGGDGGLEKTKPLGSGGISRGGVEVSVGPSSRAAAAKDQPPAAFIRSKTFQGAKSGYVFKKGPKGVGYYADKKAAASSGKAAAAPAPAAQQQQQKASKSSRKRQHRDESSEDDDNAHMRPAGANGTAANGTAAKKGDAGLVLSQEELVRRAFAGDDVVADFAAEKAAEVEAELPTADVPGALPGWGTWAGAKREPRWAVEAKAKAAAAREAAAASRADAGMQYVVISEKWDKRNAKYRTPQVPYPYDSKETYERAMRQPLGRQFNTDAGFRNLTRPAVVKDAGVVIQPVRYSAAMAQHARDEGGARRHAVLTVEGGMPKRARLDKNRGGQKGKKRVGGGGGGGGGDE